MIIEKNVPISKKASGRPIVYPFHKMDVGDSFFCEVKRSTLAPSAAAAGKRLNAKFSVRAEGKGFRVWRVK